ncbi:MAG: hypothetical protein Q8862_02190 [Bacteroidota bacterium]|nr:hypothetical protein [Bacteroidota bacterium]
MMKKLILMFGGLLLSLGNYAISPGNNDGNGSHADLCISPNPVNSISGNANSSINLHLDKSDINFDFSTFDDYKNGVGGYNVDAYSTKGAILSAVNWKFSVRALASFTSSDGFSTILLNNVGFTVQFDGDVDVVNYTLNGPKALSSNEVVLLEKRSLDQSKGDEKNNKFVVFWEMGTKKGNMNQLGILDQNIKGGSYSTQVEFVALESL